MFTHTNVSKIIIQDYNILIIPPRLYVWSHVVSRKHLRLPGIPIKVLFNLNYNLNCIGTTSNEIN